jgi:hypothetical protein
VQQENVNEIMARNEITSLHLIPAYFLGLLLENGALLTTADGVKLPAL